MSDYHETRFTFNEKRRVVWGVLTPYLQARFKMGPRVLDLGCGYGDFINHVVADERFAVDGSDAVKPALDKSVQFRAMTLPGDLTVFGKQMTTIFASNLLEHLEWKDLDRFLELIYEQLEPGGLFISLTPNFKRASTCYFDDYTHKTALTDTGLCDWLAAKGFTVTFRHPGFMPFSMKDSRLPVKPFLVKAWLYSPFKPGGAQMLIVAEKPRQAKGH